MVLTEVKTNIGEDSGVLFMEKRSGGGGLPVLADDVFTQGKEHTHTPSSADAHSHSSKYIFKSSRMIIYTRSSLEPRNSSRMLFG